MYQPRKIRDDLLPYAVALAHMARNGRLVIHAGSGLSIAEPTSLASGPELAERVSVKLENLIGPLPECDRSDLASVADAMEGLPSGLDALKQAILASNEYLSSDPNYGHSILALLAREGAAKVLTTNWDNCIERGATPELVLAVIVEGDLSQPGNPILKLHGCATRPQSMLVTSQQMASPPEWAINEAKARLANSDLAFIGTGSPAPYVEEGIKELVDAPHGSIRVVSPGIATTWDDSRWSEIVPDLPDENRIAGSADEFLDTLCCAYIRISIEQMLEVVNESEEKRLAVERVADALYDLSALFVMNWFRGAAVPRGEVSVMCAQLTMLAVIAIGLLGLEPVFRDPSQVRVGEVQYSVLIDVGQVPPARLRAEADRRLERFLSDGGSHDEAPRFLIASVLDVAHVKGPVVDVVGVSDHDDVVGGPVSGSPQLLDAREIVNHV